MSAKSSFSPGSPRLLQSQGDENRPARSAQSLRPHGRPGRLLALCLCLGLTLGGCSLFPKEEEALAPPVTKTSNVSYATQEAKKGSIVDSVTGSGSLVAAESYDVSFESRGGYLKAVYVKLGQTVKKGDLIAELDNDDLRYSFQIQQLQHRKVELSYQKAKEALEDYRARWHYEEGVEYIDDQLDALEEAFQLAEIDYQLSLLQLDKTRTELEKASIYAPADGAVAYLSTQSVGESVQARTTFARIVVSTDLEVEYTGSKLEQFVLGLPVTVTYKNKDYPGQVIMTPANLPADAGENARKAIRVQAEGLPADAKSGDTATLTIIKEQKEEVIVLPNKAVKSYGGKSYVLVLQGEVRTERIVETGIVTTTQTEIVSGLEEGELVVLG